MAAVLEARAVITATDDTGKAFDSVKARIASIDAYVTRMNRAIGSVEPVARSMGAISGQIDRTSAAMTRMGEAGRAVGGVAATIASVDRASARMAGTVAKSSQAVAGLSRDLSTAEGKLRAITDFRGASRSLDEASIAFRRGQQEVRRLQAEIGSAGVPTRAMAVDLGAAEAGLVRLRDAFKAQGAAVRFSTEELSRAGIPVNRLRSEQESLKASIEGTTAAIRQQVEADRMAAAAADRAASAERKQVSAQRHERVGGTVRQAHTGEHFDTSTLGGTIATAGAFMAEEAMHRIVERYRDFDKERRYAKVVMGLTDEEQEPLVQQALRGGATSRFTDIQWLEAQREFAARGYKLDQVKAFTPIAADVGTAFDKTLPEAVTAIEGAMLGFGKDVSTFDKAVAAARQTADYEVKASKISGMSFDDITQLYKYGAAPAKMAGLSEAQLLAFGGVLKKNNMGGDEAGTAFRALAKNLLTPTAGAVTAMRANGIDFSSYQHVRDVPMDANAFSQMVAQKYGVELNEAVRAGLGRIFTDRSIVGDAAKFTPAVVDFLKGTLGGNDAKSLKSIAGLAKDYRNASVDGVDTVRLLTDMMNAMAKNKGLANSIFGSKQGGRIFAALSDPEVFNGLLDQIRGHSAGFAGDVAAARNEGFNGQMGQLEGAIATLESSIGRAFDAHGSGGALTQAASAAARFVQSLSELNPSALRAAVEAGAGAAVLAGLKSIDFIRGGFGLKEAGGEMTRAGAVQLDAGKMMLEAARLNRGVPHEPPGGSGGPGGPHAEPGTEPAKPGEPAPEGRPGIFNKPPPAEVPKGAGKFFGGGGAKGFGAGVVEGIVGGFVYSIGDELQDYFLHRGDKEKAQFDKAMQYPALHAWLDRVFGRTDDARPADPFMGADRESIMERARRSAEAFQREPEAERGRRSLERFAAMPLATGPGNDGNALWRPAPVPAAASTTPNPMHLPVIPPSSQPIPVHVVSTSAERMPLGPLGPGMHRDFTLGNNTGGFGSPGMGSTDHFDPGPKRGAAKMVEMLDAHAVEPHVDDSQLVAFEGKLTEAAGQMDALAGKTIAPHVDLGQIQALIAALTTAEGIMSRLKGGVPGIGGGTSGSLGTSYPATAPTGRQGGPR